MDKIKKIMAREILSLMAMPTIEVKVETEKGISDRAAVDIGTSTGKYEVSTMLDGGDRLFGQGNIKAVQIINEKIAPELAGLELTEQMAIDKIMLELDGTPNKENLGGNSMLGVSMAVAKTAAKSLKIPLYQYLSPNKKDFSIPVPVLVMIHGGIGFVNQLELEDFCVIPTGFDSFSEAIESGIEIYYKLYDLLKEKHLVVPGITFVPQMSRTTEALDYLMKAIKLCDFEQNYRLGLDASASECFNPGRDTYHIDQKEISKKEIINYYKEIIKDYPFLYLEDPFDEEDTDNYQKMPHGNIQIVGDDLIASNKKRLEMSYDKKLINSILLKPNQIGTITELMKVAEYAKQHDIDIISSIRSKSTNELFLADFSIAVNATQIKAGCVTGYPATGIYNRFLEIENNEKFKYQGSFLRKKYLLSE
jgi:enolase